MRALLALFVSLVLVLPAAAQEASDAERLREIEALREQKARDAEALRRRTEAAAASMRRLKVSLVALAGSLQEAEAEVTESETRLDRLTAESVRLSAALAGRRRAVGDVLGALQMVERRRPPALMVNPADANRAAVAALALASVTPELQEEAARLAAELDRLEIVRAKAARERRLLAEAEAGLAERRRLLEDTLAEREERQAADVERLRRIEREDAALAREATTLRALIEGIAARDEAAPVRPERPQPSLPEPATGSLYASLPSRFSDARAQLPLPASGRIVRRYGEALGGGGRSQDMTLVTRPGAVVTAPFGGTVKWAKPYGALGNIVILDVGQGYSVVLMGLGSFSVSRDDQVAAGEPLGAMPADARSGLRFHLRRGGEVLDPEPWLRPQAEGG